MSNGIKSLTTFMFGAAVGSVITWLYIKNKYERIAQEEIDSVKSTLLKRTEGVDDDTEDTSEPFKRDISSVNEYKAQTERYNYGNCSDTSNDTNIKVDTVDRPYIISPDEFGEFEDYTKISLTYYADEILADDDDEIVEDVEDVVGFDSLNHFGEYEDDTVYVRNDRLKCDYEIVWDRRNYTSVVGRSPYPTED